MYRLIIADDEHGIRENLVSLVHWEGLGFQVVGEAGNGREVLALIERLHPDALLMDIKMPYMTGIDVAQHVHANRLPVRVVLLSGYQEFDLAKDAANFGVYKYLLKPTKLDDIQRTFRALKQTLDEAHASTLEYERMVVAYHDSLRMLRYQTLHDLLYLPKAEAILAHVRSMNPPLFLPAFSLLHLTFENLDAQLAEQWQYERDLFDTFLTNVARNAGSRMHISVFPLDDDSYLLVANAATPGEFSGYRELLARELKQLVGPICTMQGSPPFSDIAELRPEFIRFVPQAAHVSDMENESLLLTALVEGDAQRLPLLLRAVLEDKPPAQHGPLIARLHAQLTRGLRDMGMQPYDAPPPADEAAMLSWLNDMRGQWQDWSTQSNTAEQRLVQRIKQFMQAHLQEDLSLRRVAEHVFLSPVYVSRLFKQATGENFIDALKRMRVEKACQMLRNPELRIYEIAIATGYHSSKYFMKVFKEYTRTTPTEYRRTHYQHGAAQEQP